MRSRDQINLYDETVAYFTNRTLLLEEAERTGISVSEQELRDDILNTRVVPGRERRVCRAGDL